MQLIRRLEKEETKMRLIDADKLLQEIEFEYDLDYGETLIDPRDFADAVCDSPTVDAVPVVRCRECRYYAASGATTSFCIHPGGMKFTSDPDYCSRGKRREQSADVRNMGQFAEGGKTGGQNDADQH